MVEPRPIVTSSRLAAPAAEVWAHAVNPSGINDELRPLLRMTVPAALRGTTIEDIPLGRRAGRSWILLLGLVPFDYDDITLVEHDKGRRFLERSPMLSMRVWQHERIVDPLDGASCVLTDRVSFRLRTLPALVPGASRVVGALVRRIFSHRHRRLRLRFGES